MGERWREILSEIFRNTVRVQRHQRCAFTVDVKECRMSDGCGAIGHATGVRAIVRGCDRANAQGAGKSVMFPNGNALSLGRGGRFVMPGAGCGHGSRAPQLRGAHVHPGTGGRRPIAAARRRRRILRGRRQRPDRLYRDVIFEPCECQW